MKNVLSISFKSRSTHNDLSKAYVVPHSFLNATIFLQYVLTECPQFYFEYKVIRKFKNKYLIKKEILLQNKTWMTIAHAIEALNEIQKNNL